MKLRFLVLCVLLAFGGTLFLNTELKAADNPPGKLDAQGLMVQIRLKGWTKQLGLTEEQQQKIKPMLEDEAVRFAKIRDDDKIPVDERKKQTNALQQETYEKVRPLLTPEQLEKFNKNIAIKKKK